MINTFGKQPKNICLSESIIMAEACDEMIPLYRKSYKRPKCLKNKPKVEKL